MEKRKAVERKEEETAMGKKNVEELNFEGDDPRREIVSKRRGERSCAGSK